MRASISLFTSFLFVFFSSQAVLGYTYCVSSEAQLLSALHNSATSAVDDVIQIVQGTYIGGFVYSSGNDSNISIEGGYTEDCVSRVIDPANTILDGNNTQRVLGVANSATSGGIFNFSLSGVTLKNGRNVSGIYGGGGLSILRDLNSVLPFDVTLSHNKFVNNTASKGGGLYFSRIRNLDVTHNDLNENSSTEGAAIYSYLQKGSTIINHNSIDGNKENPGVSSSVRTAAIYISQDDYSTDSLDIVGNTISNSIDSGGMHIVLRSSGGPVTIKNNYILNNDGESGVKITGYGYDFKQVFIINNVIGYNTAYDDYGGGIDIFRTRGNITLTNNTISKNYSGGRGGGVQIDTTYDDDALFLYNNIIWDNTANDLATDLYINSDPNSNLIYADVELYNNNFDQSTTGFFISDPTFITRIDSSNLNNINPVFFNAMGADFRLNSPSPCINAGDNYAPGISTTDIDGGPRIEHSTVDMGAYEYLNPLPPVALFSANHLAGSTPLTVAFSDESSGNVSEWAWTFGDGGTSIEQNPSHTYNSIGTYTVELTVTGSNGSDSEIKTNYINVTAPPEAVVADFSATPLSGNLPLMVSFSDQSSGSIVSWAWDFDNDGSIDSTLQNPSYTYSSTGIYTVTLTVTGSNGSDSEIKTNYINVTAPPEAVVADFSATPLSGNLPLMVSFSDQSSGSIVSWAWDFDNDGSIDSTLQNPSYTYSSTGIYTVTLTVTGSNGSDSEIKTNYINVTAPPEAVVADFSATPLSGNLPLMVSFSDQSSGSIVSWAWDFDNDGSIDSTLQNPSYTYSSTGIYTVTLTVTGSNGSDSETKNNYILVTDLSTDSDSDGIPDDWEILYFQNLTTCDATSDFEKDGYTDLQEYFNMLNNETDPKGIQYHPKVINAPGGTGYTPPSSSDSFWQLMLPCIINGNQTKSNRK
jgi:PKD repeat protein